MTEPSALLQALLRASLAGALLAALALAVVRLWPRMPPAARAALFWLACARFLVALAPLPALELAVLPARPTPAASARREVVPPARVPAGPLLAAPATTASPATAEPDPAPPADRAVALLAWAIAAAWLAGALGSVVRLVRERLHLSRILRSARPVPPGHPAALAWLTLGGGLRRLSFLPAPRLVLSGAVRAPLCAGPLAPVIVLPATPLGPRALELALAHELGHLRRGDLWLAWIPALAEVALWFHPLARLAAREHAQAREEACDAFALGRTGVEPAEYGPLLVAFGTGHPRLALAAAAGAPHVRQLERRLRMLLFHVDPRRARRFSAAVLLAAAPALAPVALGSVAAPEELATGAGSTTTLAQVAPLPRKPEAAATKSPAAAPSATKSPASATKKPARAPVAEPELPAPAPEAVASPEPDEDEAPAASPAPAAAPAPAPRASRGHVWVLPTPPPAPPAPPAPPTPRVAAVPPVPPVPSPVAVGDSDFFVFKDGGEHFTVRLNDEDNLDGVNDLLASRTGPVIVFGRSGRTYLVEDKAAIEQFRAINRRMEMPEEQAAASLDQARLGAEQAELARQQADASARQARLNVQVAELGVAQRGLTGKELEKLETKREALTRQMDGISGEMDGLGKKMDALGRRMDEIGSRMDRMGERMDERARIAEKETRRLLKEWIRSGLAKPVP